MEKQSLGLSVEWIENATPEAKEEAQSFIGTLANIFDAERMGDPMPLFEVPAVIERITIKRIHA